MAVRLAEFALAIPAKVSMTPHTVPSNPMNGPPATAVESTIIPFSNAIASAAAAGRNQAASQKTNEADFQPAFEAERVKQHCAHSRKCRADSINGG